MTINNQNYVFCNRDSMVSSQQLVVSCELLVVIRK